MKMSVMKHNDMIVNIHFVNDDGVTLSIGIGSGHYCDARYGHDPVSNCELAVWMKDQDLERIGNDTVAGYVSLIHLPRILQILCSEGNAAKKIAAYVEAMNK